MQIYEITVFFCEERIGVIRKPFWIQFTPVIEGFAGGENITVDDMKQFVIQVLFHISRCANGQISPGVLIPELQSHGTIQPASIAFSIDVANQTDG